MKANYSTELRTKLFEANLDHMTDQAQKTILTTDQHSISLLKLWVATLFGVAISWQLNAASYLCGVHKAYPLLREETGAGRARGQLAI